jgi:hypothetical protein
MTIHFFRIIKRENLSSLNYSIPKKLKRKRKIKKKKEKGKE